jgi:nitrous oxidase accessory protein
VAALLWAALPAAASPRLQDLVDAAPAGSEVVVRGVVRGPVVVHKPLRIVGGPGAVVDGGGEGTVVRVEAPGVYLGRMRIRGSGSELNTEDAGVYVGAPGVVLEDLELEDVLFGLNLKGAHGSVVRRVRISGKPLPLSRRGDAVRLWYSRGVTLSDVRVENMRDVLMWFTEDSVLHRLEVRGSRYGVHYMYAHRTPLLDSSLEGNAVGAYIMYSTGVRVEGNRFLHNRDVPGVGLAFKESDAVVVRRNAVVGNAVGIYLDATPPGRGGERSVRGQRGGGERCGAGGPQQRGGQHPSWATCSSPTGRRCARRAGPTRRTAGGRGAAATRGTGTPGWTWTETGWGSSRTACAAGSRPVTDTVPAARILHGSPAVAALERAAQAVPLFPPQVVLEDPRPLVRAEVPEEFRHVDRSSAFALASAGIAALAAAGVWGACRRRTWEVRL